ncbi:Acetylornithine deacetylase/Succinyl-diaminopimelate desuccinylase [Granulicella rosea]|uniref:Acetylornithine deacetylase/Succinyl-diaminopimelate desuccinylase n=1 Tax=Granulicella rosea TaxID=474952 RepID=A0A239MK64_9BACT|nr:M20/M25/M40 family metallo-hydrolase [Granulicella rosea]SNT43055.1 Acetylornithine deacetylase/Succinyl-diaminopimelate desuccinylase [Granulicella rosea]
MRYPKLVATSALLTLALAGCKQDAPKTVASTADAGPKLGIRPYGDETIKIDNSKIEPALLPVFKYIDDHIDEHVTNLQKWIQQPSISNSGEGIPETAEMVKGFFDKLGCQESKVYDMGMTEWGQPGNPVVYAKLDEGAPKTLMVYWMYDTMPVTQPDNWVAPPFEGRLVDGKTAGLDPAFKKVLIGRGANNSKGPEMTELNAIMSMKAAMGKLPVNLIFVAEGDEERMSMGLRKFVTTHPELIKPADALLMFGGQTGNGAAASGIRGGSEGLMYLELTTSGKAWGRGPTVSDIHGAFKRSVDSPAWRHIQMLASLTSKDGNTPRIDGFMDNIQPLSTAELENFKLAAAKMDLKKSAENLGVARFISDDPLTVLKNSRYATAFNLDGIWGGNMYAGGSGAILPNKITSKHSIRYLPNMHSADILKKIRAQLDKNGYPDVQVRLIGDMPWSTMSYDTDVARSVEKMYDAFGISYSIPAAGESILMDAGGAGAWPGYLFTNGKQGDPNITPIGLPIAGGGVGFGGRSHAANEFWLIEGAGKIYGLAGAEKSIVTEIYNYSKMTTVAPKSGKR